MATVTARSRSSASSSGPACPGRAITSAAPLSSVCATSATAAARTALSTALSASTFSSDVAATAYTAFYAAARTAVQTAISAQSSTNAAFAADVLVDRFEGRITERTELKMVKDIPLPFPPEPAASIGINLTRWSLDRADHNDGKRNVLLKTLDALGLGFDS